MPQLNDGTGIGTKPRERPSFKQRHLTADLVNLLAQSWLN